MKNSPLGKLIRHPVDAADAAMKVERLKRTFGDVCDINEVAEAAMSLAPFCSVPPLRYFSPQAFSTALILLNSNVDATLDAIELHGAAVTQAVHSIFRETESWDAEERQELSYPSDFRRFDRLWHPEYQRYAEHAFNHLTRVPLELLQRARGKNYQALELSGRADKLVELGLAPLVAGFNARLRNAISHGGVHYGDYEIRYVTRNGDERHSATEFLDQFDALVDTCSAHVAALLAFVCRNLERAGSRGFERLPSGLRLLLVRGLCQHPGFDVEGLLEVGSGSSAHVNLYCESATRSRQVHLYEALHAAMQLNRFGGHYPTISISIDCGESTPACLIVDGPCLEEALIEETPPEALQKVVRANLLWHDTSAIGRWFYLLRTQFISRWAHARADVRQSQRQMGLPLWQHRYVIRAVENRSVGNLRRTLAEIVVNDSSDINVTALRAIIRHATKTLRRQRICGKDFSKLRFLRLRPAYVWLRVHYGDARVRSLQGRNHTDKRLLAMSEWICMWRRHKPIWVKQPHEVVKAIRVRWVLGESPYMPPAPPPFEDHSQNLL